MNEGLIFIWVERDLLSDVINYFENIGIKYVENIIWIKLNPTFQQSK
jgi:DNA modification methylase